MDEYNSHIKFRGGKLSLMVIAVAFASVFLTRFVPAFFPDNTGLGSLSRPATEALGCIDYEGAAILEALHREVSAPASPGEAAAIEFVRARRSGEHAAISAERLEECASDLAAASPWLAEEGKVEQGAKAVSDALIDLYSARASVLSLEYPASRRADGSLAFPDPESATSHAEARLRVQEAWKAAEGRITETSRWIGGKLSGQR